MPSPEGTTLRFLIVYPLVLLLRLGWPGREIDVAIESTESLEETIHAASATRRPSP